MSEFVTWSCVGPNGAEISTLDANWAKLAGVTSDNAVVTNNRARREIGPNGTCKYVRAEAPPSANYKAYTDIYVAGTTDTTYSAGPMIRASSGLNGYWARWRPGTGIQLFRYNSAAATQLGPTVAQAYSAGQNFRLWIEGEDNTIRVYRDDEPTPVISVVDASPILTAGKVGMILGGSSATDGPHVYGFSAQTLDSATGLTAQASTHAHASDNLTLTIAGSTDLVVASSSHGHASDNLTLTTTGSTSLTVADATHAHSADNVVLSLLANIIVTLGEWETNNLLTGETGITAWVNDDVTGALVAKITGLSSDGSTADVVIKHASMVSGTDYSVRIRTAAGAEFTWTYTAS